MAVRTPGAGLPARPRLLGPVLVVLAVLLMVGGVGISLYTDLLWFSSVDYRQVFTTVLTTRLMLFLGFGLLMAVIVGVNVYLAYRVRPPFRPMSLEQQNLERYRVAVEPFLTPVLLVGAGVFGLFAGLSAAARWQTWLLWRNGSQFGEVDAQFGRDISYFAFTYPFQRFVLGFLLTAVVLALLAAAATHYLFGGVRLQTVGEKVSPAARAHLSVLIGLIVLLKAFAYYLDRFGLAFSTRGYVEGAGFTDVNAVLPAKNILIGIALICALLFFANIVVRNILLPGRRAGPARRVRGGHRRRLPRLHPAVPRQPERDPARGAVHPAQHRGHAGGVRHRRQRGHRLPGLPGRRPGRPARPGGAGRQRPAARPEPPRADLPAAPAPDLLLRRQRPARHRPVRGRRRAAGLRRRGPRGRHRQPVRCAAQLDQRAPGLHPRQRPHRRAGRPRRRGGASAVRRARRPGQPDRPGPDAHLLRRAVAELLHRQHRAARDRRPHRSDRRPGGRAGRGPGDVQLRRRRRRRAVPHRPQAGVRPEVPRAEPAAVRRDPRRQPADVRPRAARAGDRRSRRSSSWTPTPTRPRSTAGSSGSSTATRPAAATRTARAPTSARPSRTARAVGSPSRSRSTTSATR